VLRYFAFDSLWYNGRDLTGLPLVERKKILADLIPKSSPIKYSDHIESEGQEFYKAAAAQGLEGIIAKRADSPYQEGRRSRDWLKIKTHLRQEVVIGGFTEPKGSRKYVGSRGGLQPMD
jgi:bifunctional non-homologous end joining protein LigD